MGSSLHKDENVELFVAVNKRVHYAGQMVTGAVHINCKQDRLCYQYLNLRLHGDERVMWCQNHGKYTVTYSNERQTYLQDFGLAKFTSGLVMGQYTYPFSFLLPASLPSSMHQNGSNYIHYNLSATLPNSQNHDHDQAFTIKLHVREPPKNIISNLKGQTVGQSFCCGCCCSCGTSTLNLEANVTHLQYGKTFRVWGRIDSAMSKTPIQDYKVVLKQVVTKVATMKTRSFTKQYLLYNANIQIPLGQSDTFQTQISIPQQVIGYTAVGNIISRCYYLELIGEVSCCYSNPTLSIPTNFITYLQPEFDQQEMQQPPQNWNPIVAEIKVIASLPPYIYRPEFAVLPIDHRPQRPSNMTVEMKQNYPQNESNQRVG